MKDLEAWTCLEVWDEVIGGYVHLQDFPSISDAKVFVKMNYKTIHRYRIIYTLERW